VGNDQTLGFIKKDVIFAKMLHLCMFTKNKKGEELNYEDKNY
jgi:hypothetical protein